MYYEYRFNLPAFATENNGRIGSYAVRYRFAAAGGASLLTLHRARISAMRVPARKLTRRR
jgi:hypothetical protein